MRQGKKNRTEKNKLGGRNKALEKSGRRREKGRGEWSIPGQTEKEWEMRIKLRQKKKLKYNCAEVQKKKKGEANPTRRKKGERGREGCETGECW